MKRMAQCIAIGAVLAFTGCAKVTGGPGGLIGGVQTADDQLAAKAGIPPAVLDKLRQLAGITDVRKLPAQSRVLPAGWTWKQGILDENNKEVDVTKFHRGPPYIVPDGTQVENTVTAADLFPTATAESPLPANAAALLEQILTDIQNDPTLLDAAPVE